MASFVYDIARETLLQGRDWVADNYKTVLVTSGYVANQATHEDLADVGVGTRISTSANLGTKSTTDGAVDAADSLHATVAAGSTVAAVVIYYDSGVEATSTLIAYIDNAPELPLATNGGDITVVFDSGTNKIFKWA